VRWPTRALLVFITRQEAAADFQLELHFEFLLLVERAEVLVRIHQLDVLVQLDIRGGHCAFLVDRQQQGLGIARVRFEQDLFQIQDNFGDILDHAVDGGELMHRPVDFNRGDGGAFQRGKQHPAQGVADRVAVTGFKWFGDKLRIGFRGGCVILDQPLGHFKTSETYRHIFLSTILIWLLRRLFPRTAKARIIVLATYLNHR
jgi:hypothetical protein